MVKCCLVEECPEFEIRKPLILIHSEGRCVALTAYVLASFLAEGERALAQFHRENAEVVQFRTS